MKFDTGVQLSASCNVPATGAAVALAIAPLIKKRVGGCRHGTDCCQVNN